MGGVAFVVDDDPGVRRAVSRLLRSHDLQGHTRRSANKFLNESLPKGPACMVLDLQMPGVSRVDLQHLLGQKHEIVSIVFISGHVSIPASVRAMKKVRSILLPSRSMLTNCRKRLKPHSARARQACTRRDARDRDRAIFETLIQRAAGMRACCGKGC